MAGPAALLLAFVTRSAAACIRRRWRADAARGRYGQTYNHAKQTVDRAAICNAPRAGLRETEQQGDSD